MAFAHFTRSAITRVASKSPSISSTLAFLVPSSYIFSKAQRRNSQVASCEPIEEPSPPLPPLGERSVGAVIALNQACTLTQYARKIQAQLLFCLFYRPDANEQTNESKTTVENWLNLFDELKVDAVFFKGLSIGAFVGFCAGFALKKVIVCSCYRSLLTSPAMLNAAHFIFVYCNLPFFFSCFGSVPRLENC